MVLAGPVKAKVSVGNEPVAVRRRLGQVELGNRDGGDLLQQRGIPALGQVKIAALLGRDIFGRAFRQARDFAPTVQDGIELLLDFRSEVESGLVFPGTLGFVALAEGGGGRLVVAGHGGECFVGHTAFQLVTVSKAHDGIAAFDMVVEEVERLAVVSFGAESHLTQFDSQGVQIHVDALADNVAYGDAEGSGAGCSSPVRMMASSAAIRRAAASRMARAAGDVGHTQRQQRFFSIGFLQFLRNQIIQRMLDEWLNQVIWSVVGASRGAFIARVKANSTWLAAERKCGLYSSSPSYTEPNSSTLRAA